MTNLKDKKGRLFQVKNADSVVAGDHINIFGEFLKVTKTIHVNRHPYQLYELYVAEFREPLRVPAGWQIKVRVV